MTTGFNYWYKVAPILIWPIVAKFKPGAILCQEHIAARIFVSLRKP